MNIANLIDIARQCGFGRFDSVTLNKSGGRWLCTLHDSDKAVSGLSSHGGGDTPEEAFLHAEQNVKKWIEDKRKRASNELADANEMLAKFGVPTNG